ncbi:MAG: hypothetical protein WC547_10870, partial [Candidatus Omnitrophota bacterium]
MVNKSTLIIAAFIAALFTLPSAARAEGQGLALGQAVELTGSSLPEEMRNFTGVGSGASSWDYLSQKISYGYFIEVYSHFDALAKSKVDRRNGIEDLVVSSYKTDSLANIAVADVKFNQDYAQHVMATEFAQRSGRGTQIANTYTLNTYLPHSDGSVEYFKDGLLARVDNQRSVDEFGNVSYKNLRDFIYAANRRLMLSHEYDRTDSMGNVTHGVFSCTYTADSVFYGGDNTNANKNYQSYTVTETGHTGRVTTTTWTALKYEGKYLRESIQVDTDSLLGTRSLHRSNIQYSAPGAITSYDEYGVINHIEGEEGTDVPYTYYLHRYNIEYGSRGQTTSYDQTMFEMPPDTASWTDDMSKWTKITSHVTMEYAETPNQFGQDVDPDQGRLLKQTTTSNVENPDGSYRDETGTVEYTYDDNYNLIGASASGTFSGLASDWISYTDGDGNQLSKSIKHDKDGNIIKDGNGNIVYEYSYWVYNEDAKTTERIIVATTADETDPGFTSQVTATVVAGAHYTGTSETAYEIMCGMPVATESHSTTSYLGAADDDENNPVVTVSDTTTTYTYGLVANTVKLLETNETIVTSQPELDPDGSHQTTRTVKTVYTYNETTGALENVEGTGTETGWQYSESQGFNNQYTSDITVAYEVKLDKPLEKCVDEKITYTASGTGTEDEDPGSYTTSEALMGQAWKYYDQNNSRSAALFLNEVVARYADEAAQQQASLSGFAANGTVSQY